MTYEKNVVVFHGERYNFSQFPLISVSHEPTCNFYRHLQLNWILSIYGKEIITGIQLEILSAESLEIKLF